MGDGLNRASRRAMFSGPRAVSDLLVAQLPASPFVLVGMRGDGYVRLEPPAAREHAFAVLSLAGVDAETLDVMRALIPDVDHPTFFDDSAT